MKTTVKQITAGAFLAILLVIGNTNAKATEVEIFKQTTETTLDIENWMIDEKVWGKNSLMNYEIFLEAEPGLELENWMTSESTWSSTANFIEEMETELLVEDWMTSESVWISKENVIEEIETQLTVENWMVSDNIWNKE